MFSKYNIQANLLFFYYFFFKVTSAIRIPTQNPRIFNLKGAIAKENALLQLKPIKVVDECREFE